jgi:hypothetical protein
MKDMIRFHGKTSSGFESIRIGQRPSIEAALRSLAGIGAGIGD